MQSRKIRRMIIIVILMITMGFILFYSLKQLSTKYMFKVVDTKMEKLQTSEEKREYLCSLGVKKLIILGSQVWEKFPSGGGSESAYWIAYYGIVPLWEEDISNFLKSIPLFYSTKVELQPKWREMGKKSLISYVKQNELSGGASVIDTALEYIKDENKSPKDRAYVIEFIGDVWFEDFYKALTSSKQGEIFDNLNLQAAKFIDNILSLPDSSSQIKDSKEKFIKRFYGFYLSESILPPRFKESPSFSNVRTEKAKHPFVQKITKQLQNSNELAVATNTYKTNMRKSIASEGESLSRSIMTTEHIYFTENKGHYTDKWEDISGDINLTKYKYFTTPPTLTTSGEGDSATFTATVVGSGEAEGVSVSINEKGEVTITGLE